MPRDSSLFVHSDSVYLILHYTIFLGVTSLHSTTVRVLDYIYRVLEGESMGHSHSQMTDVSGEMVSVRCIYMQLSEHLLILGQS
jgi:hypothetical protein